MTTPRKRFRDYIVYGLEEPGEKLVAYALEYFMDRDGKCTPTATQLLQATGFDDIRTVRKYVSAIETKNSIEKLKQTGKANQYKVIAKHIADFFVKNGKLGTSHATSLSEEVGTYDATTSVHELGTCDALGTTNVPTHDALGASHATSLPHEMPPPPLPHGATGLHQTDAMQPPENKDNSGEFSDSENQEKKSKIDAEKNDFKKEKNKKRKEPKEKNKKIKNISYARAHEGETPGFGPDEPKIYDPKRFKNAHKLPDYWRVSAELRHWAKTSNLVLATDFQIDSEAADFRDWADQHGTTMKDWNAAFRTRMRNARKWGNLDRKTNKNGSFSRNYEDDFLTKMRGICGDDTMKEFGILK